MRPVLFLVLPFACCLSTTLTHAATDPWKSAHVLPKSVQVRLTDEAGRDVGSVFQIAWPAKVEKVEGQWLQIRDSGAYSVPPLAAWVRKSEMLRFSDDGGTVPRTEDPRSYYTDQIEANPRAPGAGELHWLRGLYSESQSETDVAIQDYCAAADALLPPSCPCRTACRASRPPAAAASAATSASPTPDSTAALVAADACLHLGSLLAQKKSIDETVSDEAWQDAFGFAQAQFASAGQGVSKGPPGLYLAWGKAAFERYKALRRAKDDPSPPAIPRVEAAPQAPPGAPPPKPENTAGDFFCLAAAKFKAARAANGGWSDPYVSLGELYLAVGEPPPSKSKTAPEKQAQPKCDANDDSSVDPLATAITWFDAAIRVNPRLDQAYRERAEAMFDQANQLDAKPAKAKADGGSTSNSQSQTDKATPCPSRKDKPTSDTRPSKKEKLLRKAAESADAACRLNFYIEPKSLELLSQIAAGLAAEAFQHSEDDAKAYYDQAADLAHSAAQAADDAGDKARLKSFEKKCLDCKTCPAKCDADPAVLRKSSGSLRNAPPVRFGE